MKVSHFRDRIGSLGKYFCKELNVYGENIDEIWQEFQKLFRIIEAAGGLLITLKVNSFYQKIRQMGSSERQNGKRRIQGRVCGKEIEEETGLRDELVQFINTTYHIYVERNGEKILKCTHWFEMNFNGEDTSKPQIEEGITEVAWKNTSQIKDEVFPSTFKNIKLIVKKSSEI
jgi:hypothetical protein